MPVIDVHTHMLTLDYLELLRTNGTGKYTLKKTMAGQDAVHLYDALDEVTLASEVTISRVERIAS
jgi:Fe-S cluster assembly ATPase SufC